MALLEVCCGTLESAQNALAGGAGRIELCAALDEGGLTPSYGLMHAVAHLKGIRKHVLIRPRGGDFLYSEAEVNLMLEDIALVRRLGLDGVVVGALLPDGDIDVPTMRRLMAAAGGLSVTFHRAFDLCRDKSAALERLVELGVNRVLTSGGAPTAWAGRETLRHLVEQAAGRIGILPGAGVTPENAADILRATGACEIHASLRVPLRSKMRYQQQGVTMGAADRDEFERKETSTEKVEALLKEISSIAW